MSTLDTDAIAAIIIAIAGFALMLIPHIARIRESNTRVSRLTEEPK